MLLSVSNIAKTFGADSILSGVTFQLAARDKAALVGRNGTGKTTLLRIITGQTAPDSGSANLARGAKVGYLRQEAPVTLGRTVLEEAQASMQHQLELKSRLEMLEARIANPGVESPEAQARLEADLEEYALLHEHFLEAEGYSAERDVRVVLQRMGFAEEDFGKKTDQLSGGEKTRLALARMLLEEPELLILDEPTNHLDLQATEWLEGWLRQYHGAVLLVSHDREFLTNTAERVLELRDGTVKSYPGPFDHYLKLRSEEEARQAEVAKRQQQDIAKLDDYVRRFMNSQRTAQARGRLKQMNRLIENRIEAPKTDKGMKGGFAPTKRSGDLVIECEGLVVGFIAPSPVKLFEDLDWTVRYRERWGVIGENGAGKSTLIKTILGLLPAMGGRVRLGTNLEIGYFSQDTQELDLNQSPLDFLVWQCDMLPADARNLLGRFLITGDDVYRPIKTLSGGEKNKLSLARLTHQQPNLLILDEPTNHLDMDSREALAKVLLDYKGTLVLVSHDRWLLSQVTDHTLDIRRGGSIQFSGSYAEYRRGPDRARSPEPALPASTPIPLQGDRSLSPHELSKEIQKQAKLVEEIESQIASLEWDIRGLEEQLANLPPTADVLSLTRGHQQMREQLQGAMASWEEQTLRLEGLRSRQG